MSSSTSRTQGPTPGLLTRLRRRLFGDTTTPVFRPDRRRHSDDPTNQANTIDGLLTDMVANYRGPQTTVVRLAMEMVSTGPAAPAPVADEVYADILDRITDQIDALATRGALDDEHYTVFDRLILDEFTRVACSRPAAYWQLVGSKEWCDRDLEIAVAGLTRVLAQIDAQIVDVDDAHRAAQASLGINVGTGTSTGTSTGTGIVAVPDPEPGRTEQDVKGPTRRAR